MKASFCVLLVSFLLATGCARNGGIATTGGAARTSLLPGVNYYGGPEDLSGSFLFLVAKRDSTGTRVAPAAIYEFVLRKGQLRKITDCPPGYLTHSRSGELLCVISEQDEKPAARAPFLYAQSMKNSYTVQLERPPQETVLIGHHALFLIRDWYYLVDYDFDTQKKRFLGYHNESTWGRGRVSGLSENLDASAGTGTLHFRYYHWEGVTDGPPHDTGFYDLDVRTGSIHWSAQQVYGGHSYRAHNGKFVYFKGSESPLHGFELATSPWEDDTWGLRNDPKGKLTRVLHTFRRHRIPGGCYTLDCMSPDGTYALVSHDHGLGGWRDFYVVNVESGKTDLILRDKSIIGGRFEVGPVSWVPSWG